MKKSGFTLIEIAVALLVFTTLILGAAAMNRYSGTGIMERQIKRESVVVANHVMERYWNQSYGDLISLSSGSPKGSEETIGTKSVDATAAFSMDSDSRGDDYVLITVTVNFGDDDDPVVLSTRRYELGLSKAGL